ncbi:hypothetical protein CDSM653_02531 [Caldanaerobacter subterraneus subsp. pacificus DSM 12653]|uniref:Uncharacterized protein n=3 Tax=Caldanaerobacter subterraneus TaxID=911092 RepID=A0A0F5PKU6_9THEO|nr:hypothetical protein CDSM653_02531 [Caldanaerobacter subterraneus subsp. pacificus DSM 12653]
MSIIKSAQNEGEIRMREIEYLITLAEIKDTEYKNLLALISLIDLLVEKGIITRSELAQKSKEIAKIKTAL